MTESTSEYQRGRELGVVLLHAAAVGDESTARLLAELCSSDDLSRGALDMSADLFAAAMRRYVHG